MSTHVCLLNGVIHLLDHHALQSPQSEVVRVCVSGPIEWLIQFAAYCS